MNKNNKIIIFIIGLILILCTDFFVIFNLNVSNYIVYSLLAIGVLLILLTCKENHKHFKLTSKEMVLIALQGAISALLYIYIKFPLPFFPSFLDIQISEIPALITSFMYGPINGLFVLLIRFIIKLPFTGTIGVGEIADLIISSTLIIVSGLIYKKNRTFKGAIKGLILGMILSIFIAIIVNYLILIPFYLQLYFNGAIEPLIKMCSMIPNINKDNFMILYLFVGVLPFNIIRFSLVFILTLFLYKKISFIFNKIIGK